MITYIYIYIYIYVCVCVCVCVCVFVCVYMYMYAYRVLIGCLFECATSLQHHIVGSIYFCIPFLQSQLPICKLKKTEYLITVVIAVYQVQRFILKCLCRNRFILVSLSAHMFLSRFHLWSYILNIHTSSRKSVSFFSAAVHVFRNVL